MVVVVSGTREITDRERVFRTIEASGFEIAELVHGDHRGVWDKTRKLWLPGPDRLGGLWAAERGIPVTPFPADWGRWGYSAGPIRNGEMLVYALRRAAELKTEAGLVTIWNGRSRGVLDILTKARRINKRYPNRIRIYPP